MKARKVPCIIVVRGEAGNDYAPVDFRYWAGSDSDDVEKFYFGDKLDPQSYHLKAIGEEE